MAGFDLGVLPIGDWSISITLSSASTPSIVSWSPGIVLALLSVFASDLYSISFTRELFPDPETPVTHVIIPRGICTSIFFKLFCLAPFIVI